MTRVTANLEELARRLIAHEANLNKAARAYSTAVFPVPEKLRPHLSIFMGKAGFRALLARALALAGTDVPWLRGLQVKADGSLLPAPELMAKVSPSDILTGRVAVLSQLLGLLVAFIGEKLTLRLVHEVWPTLSAEELHFGKRIKK